MTFFFCRFDHQASLKARIVLSSLIRQCITVATLTGDIQTHLGSLFTTNSPDVEELIPLLGEVIALSKTHFIVIDGLDECAKAERDLILNALQHVYATARTTINIFFAGRESLDGEIKARFTSCFCRTMKVAEVQADIKQYIDDITQQKIDTGELQVSSSELGSEIQGALLRGAEGM